ncbi:gamma-interferon-responsive lysosomal thiol protein-like [Prosopis cineraria]|uniref:gamma-interferon-responsive lysosomal thiol protein-like n=1 Tax=Prosopis cineraria TaxID=364024 RepID=UPI00241069F0|nr:gamma-interferon-responsive lysosomal thiol protein-like [Prosopis cineraria]
MTYASHSFNNISDDRFSYRFHQSQPRKVNLALYYETLCPDSQSFILDHLVRVFDTDLKFIVNLHLVPFGNARIFPHNKTVNCQHGSLECYYNTIEACALKVWPLTLNFPFIHCVETRLHQKDKDTNVWQLCANHLGLNPGSIKKCCTTGLGNKLILHNAEETSKLNPPLKYLPWVTVNDEPLFRDYNNVINYICNAYRGNPKPSACKTTSSIPQSPSLCDPPNLEK